MADASGPAAPEQSIGVVVIHGVGETETGWINEHIVDPICSGADAPLKAVDYSEWHRLPDTGLFAEGVRFGTILRSGQREGARIKYAEMRWSDITQVGRNQVGQLMASIKLSFEAPDVLAHAFLRGRRRGIHWLIALCILWSSR